MPRKPLSTVEFHDDIVGEVEHEVAYEGEKQNFGYSFLIVNREEEAE